MTEKHVINVRSTAKLEFGEIRYKFENYIPVENGDIIAVYVNDYEIGRSEINYDEINNHKSARISICNIPFVDFPIIIRSIVINKNIIPENIIIKDIEDLLKTVPWSASDAEIIDLANNKITISLKIEHLSQYTRDFFLVVNGKIVDSSKSQIQTKEYKSPSEIHMVEFVNNIHINEYDDIEIIEKIHHKLVLKEKINWFKLASIFSAKIENYNKKIITLEEDIRILKKKFDLVNSISLNRQGLDRIDIYYKLLNAKIDRLRLSHDNTSIENDSYLSKSDDKILSHASVRMNACDIDGVGVYYLESEGDRQWKWIAPRVTVAFKSIPYEIRSISIHFWNFSHESNSKDILIDMNGKPIRMDARKTSEGWELRIPIEENISHYSDRTAIIHIEFRDFIQPENDSRLLSAVLNYVEYEI